MMNFINIDWSKLKPIVADPTTDMSIDSSRKDPLKTTFLLKGNAEDIAEGIALNSGAFKDNSISLESLKPKLIILHLQENSSILIYLHFPHGNRNRLSYMQSRFPKLTVSVVEDIKNFSEYAIKYKAKYGLRCEVFKSIFDLFNMILFLKSTNSMQKKSLLNKQEIEEKEEEENADDISSDESLSGSESEYRYSEKDQKEIERLKLKIRKSKQQLANLNKKRLHNQLDQTEDSNSTKQIKTEQKSVSEKKPGLFNALLNLF